jgi:hypothetical protein
MLEHQSQQIHSSFGTPKGQASNIKITVSAKENKYPVLNGKYALKSRLGEGNTSKVYLA